MATPTSGKNMSPRHVIMTDARTAPAIARRLAAVRRRPARVGRRRGHDDEDEQRPGAVVDQAVVDAGCGDEGITGVEALFLRAERESPVTLEHVVDLVLVLVAVRLLRLARRHAVEVELGPARGGERDLRHLVGRRHCPLPDADLHALASCRPPCDAAPSARSRSDTGWATSTSTPRARQCWAICIRQPGLPAATIRAPVSRIRSALRRPRSPAISGSSRLYTPALPQQSSLSLRSMRATPGMRRSSSRGSDRMRWPCARWQAS